MKTLIGLLAAFLLVGCVAHGEDKAAKEKRFPVPSDYPPGVMEETTFTAAVPEQWRLHTLRTPERLDAPWRIIIVTGTPSWSEFWAPTIAKLPPTREMIVVDRPGFSASQPQDAVTDIAKQAQAISPLLDGHPGQRVVVLGQSFGSPVATLLAAAHPGKVDALVLASSYFGDRGPTARRLFGVGRLVRPLLPRDLKNSITEVSAQGPQLPRVWEALRSLTIPVVFIHGDNDTFVPLAASRRIAAQYDHTLIDVPNGDHFLNACCVDAVLASLEEAIAEAEQRAPARPPEAHLTAQPTP
ncbi:MAG: alpha/beta fold hydrolase [Hyphomonadaceae bacterium]|nr:alpha/beta fold hydrolase [Hyphomonadaceae bacterium]